MIVEACVQSVEDAISAERAGAQRLELVYSMYMGGITPSVGLLREVKKHVSIPVIAMVRPRGGGFYYSQFETDTMLIDAKILLENGADGLAFGVLNEEGDIHQAVVKQLIDLCHQYDAGAVVHRAFDNTHDLIQTASMLIELGVDRILTSGGRASAQDGAGMIATLVDQFGDKVEFLVGGGVSAANVIDILKTTGATQVHGSFSMLAHDPTTIGPEGVSYRYRSEGDYEAIDPEKIHQVVEVMKRWQK